MMTYLWRDGGRSFRDRPQELLLPLQPVISFVPGIELADRHELFMLSDSLRMGNDERDGPSPTVRADIGEIERGVNRQWGFV
jgi:hypothetical protein